MLTIAFGRGLFRLVTELRTYPNLGNFGDLGLLSSQASLSIASGSGADAASVGS